MKIRNLCLVLAACIWAANAHAETSGEEAAGIRKRRRRCGRGAVVGAALAARQAPSSVRPWAVGLAIPSTAGEERNDSFGSFTRRIACKT